MKKVKRVSFVAAMFVKAALAVSLLMICPPDRAPKVHSS